MNANKHTVRAADSRRFSLRKRFSLIFGGIVLAAGLLYSGRNPQYQTGVFNDDAVYVMAARNLWTPGFFPIEPSTFSRQDFPFPGLPLFLAPFVKAVEPHWIEAEWLSVTVTLLSVVIFGLWIKNWLSPSDTLVVLALYAFNPVVARYSGVLMPTVYFMAALVACFWLMDLLLKSCSVRTALALSGVLAWGSMLRPEGILLPISVAAGLAYARRWKTLAWALAAPLICWIIFFIRWRRHRELQTEYGGDLHALAVYWPHHLNEALRFSSVFLRDLCLNTIAVVHVPPGPAFLIVKLLAVLVFLILTTAGFWRLWKKEEAPRPILVSIALTCALYFFIHVYWHVAIARYCVVLLPFVLVFLWRGFYAWPLSAGWRKGLSGALLLGLASSYAYHNTQALYQSLWMPNPLNIPPQRSLVWISQRTPDSARILSTVAPSITLYSRRVAISFLPASDEEEFFYLLGKRHLDYIVDRPVKALDTGVIESKNPNRDWDRIRRWLHLFPARYRLVFEDPVEKVSIYQVARDPGYLPAYERYLSAINELRLGHSENALAILRQCAAGSPALGSADNTLGVLDYLSQTNLPEAERAFLKAIILLPDNSVQLLNVAALYHLEGRNEESLTYLRRGLAVSAANGDQNVFLEKVGALLENHEILLPENFPSVQSRS